MGFILLASITFLSAFLLFQIELILGKMLLPQYGGSYLVWGACIVFFQGVLLLGYVFAHSLITRFDISRYLKWHCLLLLIPLFFFPGRELHLSTSSTSHLPLVIDVFWRLLITIGPVFFVLSSISLVTQTWLSRSFLSQRQNPYALYAISNCGSFLALLTYPFIVEHFLGLSDQVMIWRCGYIIFLACSILAFWLIKTHSPSNIDHRAQVHIPFLTQMRWLVLSAGGVVMFLSVTNIISYEIAPVPLLWIFPLSIYLLSFVFNFGNKPLNARWLNSNIGGIVGLNLALFFFITKTFVPTIIMVIVICGFLFDVCMFAQRSLIQSKPKDDSQLTRFYVIISLGGFLGGILATWIVPLMSTMLIEFMIGLLLISLVTPQSKQGPLWKAILSVLVIFVILFWWPLIFKKYSILGVALLFLCFYFAFRILSGYKILFIAVLIAIISAGTWLESHWKGDIKFIAKHRNYYGIYNIYDKDNIRLIIHGTTLHGVQFNQAAQRYLPMGYYSPISAPGDLILKNYFNVTKLGVVGLGAGTLAMYSKSDLSMDIFELDPDVLTLAQKYFWYLSLAPGEVKTIIGDARVSLQDMPDASYQLLAIDAFGGDAIPVHLINKDVIRLYARKITPDGGILFHITNRYVDLKPVLANIARELGSWVAVKEVPDGGVNMRSIWVIMTWDRNKMAQLITEAGWESIASNDYPKMRTWSDDYSYILPMLKLEEFGGALKNFKFWKL